MMTCTTSVRSATCCTFRQPGSRVWHAKARKACDGASCMLTCGANSLMNRPLRSRSLTTVGLFQTKRSLNHCKSSASDFIEASRKACTGLKFFQELLHAKSQQAAACGHAGCSTQSWHISSGKGIRSVPGSHATDMRTMRSKGRMKHRLASSSVGAQSHLQSIIKLVMP